MKSYSLAELFRMSRSELFALHRQNAAVFDRLPIGNFKRRLAETNMRLIRQVLAHPSRRPG